MNLAKIKSEILRPWEPPSGFLSKIKPERGQEGHDRAEVFLRMLIHNYKPCIAFFRETPNFPKILRAVGENEIPCKSYLLNFLKGLSIGGFFELNLILTMEYRLPVKYCHPYCINSLL